ncbi:hypothetical protein [Spiroplasma endosymbiont of Polydrusus formosus]|uniref:hypothetical protein n=1 Tax=Spiroplasma endosymbiont of Polydrusus formosus TaxID=3139326 RepID=UPI0035B50F5E
MACSIKINEDNIIAKVVGFFAKLLSGYNDKDKDIYYLEENIDNLENISHKLIAEDNIINIF